MLDRSKVIRELQNVSDRLFLDASYEHELARVIWQHIAADPLYTYTVRSLDVPWPISSWHGRLDHAVSIDHQALNYTVYAVDGSQIYPDRHQGVSCFLINIGTVSLSYGTNSVPITFATEPRIFLGDEYEQLEAISVDAVNMIREELELKTVADLCPQTTDPFLVLLDSPLTFWFLDTKEPQLRTTFLPRYLDSLWQLYSKKIMHAGYISMPRSRDLVAILRAAIERDDLTQRGVTHEIIQAIAASSVEYKEKLTNKLVDSTIVRWITKPYQRTTLFKSTAAICASYPPPLVPYFYYLNVGSEIVRIEIPAWIAQDEPSVDLISRICLDQAIKGHGYPVALAEGHEMAVVKNHDREFFYHLLTKLGITYKKRFALSQKSLKKRGLGV